jgi:NADPH2:quinone reductase
MDQADPAAAIKADAREGVDRIIEVAFYDNVDLDAAVAKNHTVIAAYASREGRPGFPFWPMLSNNITIRLLGSDDDPPAAKQQAVAELNAAALDGALSIAIGTPLPLERVAQAHDRVDARASRPRLADDSRLIGSAQRHHVPAGSALLGRWCGWR